MRAVTLISVACLVATGTFVSASGAVADTTHAHEETSTFDGAVPCVTDDALITITYNEESSAFAASRTAASATD